MTPSEALRWLYSTQQFGIKLGLENTHRLLAAVGNPRGRFLHVAGTNGKGSVCAMLDSILRAAGRRTGLYTSPHLVDFRERIRVDGEMIPEAELARILTELRAATESWPHAPTFFELATVLAIRHFADAQCDYVVLETGMGGRLDSTNAITPLVSVITPIAMDHAQWLGDSLAEIAAEKAGIIKPAVPVVSAPQEPVAEDVLRDRAREAGASIEFVTKPGSAREIGLTGSHQRWNAALALAALEAGGIKVPEAAACAGLRDVQWPGRFQRLRNFVLDGGHNPHAARQLVATWRETFGDGKARVIFGALEDKDYREMLEILAEIASEFWIVPIQTARAANPLLLAETSPFPARLFASLPEALAEAGSDRTLVTGSLFLVGEALESLEEMGRV